MRITSLPSFNRSTMYFENFAGHHATSDHQHGDASFSLFDELVDLVGTEQSRTLMTAFSVDEIRQFVAARRSRDIVSGDYAGPDSRLDAQTHIYTLALAAA